MEQGKQLKINERVEGDAIYLDESGFFPKKVIVQQQDDKGFIREVAVRTLQKTKSGKYLTT